MSRIETNNVVERLIEALAERDALAAKCPNQKRFHAVCPRCKAIPRDHCGLITGADCTFVEAARASLTQGGKTNG